jgi:two-component system, LuxR family, response regulator FixJ
MRTSPGPASKVHIIDDDAALRDSLVLLLQANGISSAEYESAENFLERLDDAQQGCVLLDVNMPGISGIELLSILKQRGFSLPCIVMTGSGQVPIAVKAMKAGAVDFIEKPFEHDILIQSIRHLMDEQDLKRGTDDEVSEKLARLTPRERDVMMGVAHGKQNKVIASELGISPRTVEIHRARVMAKLEAAGVADIVKFSLAAGLQKT